MFKVYVFLMFGMKYLIIECNVTHYHNKCDDLMEGVFASFLKIEWLNLTNGVFVVNSGKLTKYSPMYSPIISAYLSWLHGLCT
jgi:hypothetical protein